MLCNLQISIYNPEGVFEADLQVHGASERIKRNRRVGDIGLEFDGPIFAARALLR